MKSVELRPVAVPREALSRIEGRIRRVFVELMYRPLLDELRLNDDDVKLKNALGDIKALRRALESGRVVVDAKTGTFSGAFTVEISKELVALGAKWNRIDKTYRIDTEKMPAELLEAAARSIARFDAVMRRSDDFLANLLPEKISEHVDVEDIFDSTLFRVDRELLKSLPDGITVPPQLSSDQRKQIAAEWQDNLERWIQDFSAEEIKSLRAEIQESAFRGNRWAASVEAIQKSYGVTRRKAEFLAQQETGLLVAKFKEVRYRDAGSQEYRWSCVKMPHDKSSHEHVAGNVRYAHGLLDGKVFRWDDPPVTTAPGEPTRRNHPGEDYRCRCIAIPRVNFVKERPP